jgi:PDZ domain-containing protein
MRAIIAIAFTSIAIAFLLANCASAPTQQAAAPRPITCKAGPDCDAKWSRAVSWVTTNSSFKIQTQTESIVQTMGPLRSDPSPAFTVTKVAVGNDSYEITFTGGCGNIFGCIPTIPESRINFTNFVLAVENPPQLRPAPQVPSTAAIVLGVHPVPIAQANATGAKSEAASGLYVAQVDAGTPAERAGIIKGDVILSYAVASREKRRPTPWLGISDSNFDVRREYSSL